MYNPLLRPLVMLRNAIKAARRASGRGRGDASPSAAGVGSPALPRSRGRWPAAEPVAAAGNARSCAKLLHAR